jgi:hypothetical protein
MTKHERYSLGELCSFTSFTLASLSDTDDLRRIIIVLIFTATRRGRTGSGRKRMALLCIVVLEIRERILHETVIVASLSVIIERDLAALGWPCWLDPLWHAVS